MPRSISSHPSVTWSLGDDGEAPPNDRSGAESITPTSPVLHRRSRSDRTIETDSRPHANIRIMADESSSLLGGGGTAGADNYRSIRSMPTSIPGTPGRSHAHLSGSRMRRNHSRTGSFSMRLVQALGTERRQENAMQSSFYSVWNNDDRVWYDQFTSTDWVHDSIADAYRVKALRSRKDLRGRLLAWFDGAQGWILVAIIGCLTAMIAYFVNVTESTIFDYKFGYCTTHWYLSKKKCCSGASTCDEWNPWPLLIDSNETDDLWIGFAGFIISVIVLSFFSSVLTLMTKTVIPSLVSLSTLDENLGADDLRNSTLKESEHREPSPGPATAVERPPMVYYPAAGSGVAEVKVILSGFVLHGYLGAKTFTIKTLALVLSVASGLSLGKEGPYVHIATCIGNVMCRLFSKYNQNDGKRREVLSASAAAGVAVAFGAPIGGVLFSLEEVSYYFPPKTLFRTFFCCIAAALSLKFLNPYGTNKIVLFEVRYTMDWHAFEMVGFIATGILGGILGALFIKASRIWARTFRRIPIIKQMPLLEVFLVAVVTGLTSFWNRYTKLPVTELLFELASPCDAFTSSGTGLCPTKEQIPDVIWYLFVAFVIKALLTVVTFGIKVPAGIYVPSMVVGGLMGRAVGHFVQFLALHYSDTGLFGGCTADSNPEACVVPGVYAMVAAGATMTGVTRLTVTLAVILFELTGSLDHVLPFSIGILVAKWTADAIEPLSIYDLLTDMNSYPFLDNKIRPIFTSELGDITPRFREERIIDISDSPLVPPVELREKLDYLHSVGEIDGGLSIVKDGILVGLIPAPDLEFALDKLPNESNSLCLMSTKVQWNSGEDDEEEEEDPTDFTRYIDPSPVSLDIHSPMDLVYECFVKLGLRYICVVQDGRYAGLVHKKAFVKYTKEMDADGF